MHSTDMVSQERLSRLFPEISRHTTEDLNILYRSKRSHLYTLTIENPMVIQEFQARMDALGYS
jgi:hypothetical protein